MTGNLRNKSRNRPVRARREAHSHDSVFTLIIGDFLGRAGRSRLVRGILLVVVACEALVASAWLAFFLERSPGHVEFGVGLLATHILVVVAFLCGGRAEQQHAWFSRLSRAVESRRSYYEPIRIDGDPTLARILMLRPARHVATLTSPEEMSRWREAIRRQLIADLYGEVFVAKEKRSTFHALQEVSVGGGVSRPSELTMLPTVPRFPRISSGRPSTNAHQRYSSFPDTVEGLSRQPESSVRTRTELPWPSLKLDL